MAGGERWRIRTGNLLPPQATPTHLVLPPHQGRRFVPPTDWTVFYLVVLQASQRVPPNKATRGGIVEALQEQNHVFFDVDVSDPDKFADTEWSRVFETIYASVKESWGPDTAMGKCFVSEAIHSQAAFALARPLTKPTTTTTTTDDKRNKLGFHLIFSEAPSVQCETMIVIANHAAHRLAVVFPSVHLDTWREVIDCAPYKGVGRGALRMLWQPKSPTCPRMHTPVGYVNDGGTFCIGRGGLGELELLAKHSIHDRMALNRPRKRPHVPEVTHKGALDMRKPENNNIIEVLLRYIRYYLGKEDIAVRDVVLSNHTTYTVYTDYLYCSKMGKDHRNAGQIFIFRKRTGIFQKCGCRCEHRGCKEWEKRWKESLPDAISEVLYPAEARVKKRQRISESVEKSGGSVSGGCILDSL